MTIIAGLDIETTGLLTPDHRIIEVYIGLWRDDKKVFEYERRIDPQRSIAADAQKVHGITASDLMGKPTFDMIAPDIVKILSRAHVFIAHNGAEFDGPFLKQELRRVGHSLPQRPIFDTMLEGVWATPTGKKPRLQELCFACGIDYDPAKAHAAAYDVDRMMECLFRGASWGFFALPEVEIARAA